MIEIQSGFKMPKQKRLSKTLRAEKIFSEYSRTYYALFGSQLDHFNILDNGYIAPVMSNRQQESMSLQRMKQLTRIYKLRLLDK